MNKIFIIAIACLGLMSFTGSRTEPVGPIPTTDQIALQDMEMYAFIHYSLNTYTDQEWGYGDESPALFNPDSLDVRQWVATCKNAGMKGIIFTAKHHCGFCMWPSAYTDYSVKSSPWLDGKGDVVALLAEACREAGLKFAVYLSPWDRNHPEYGRPAYVEYFRNQLQELLTNYGPIFEVWFDGANGGDGWYGGANERRQIDRLSYYDWDQTYDMIRWLQPHCVIWNDGANLRGDLRWVGTEAGNIGHVNWSLMKSNKDPEWGDLHYGIEDGDVWCPGETNTSIRPGWFHHRTEDGHVKSLSKLMDTYYKSVGRNSTLLLNFPVQPNGLICAVDSARGAAFNNMIQKIFSNDLARDLEPVVEGDSVYTLDFGHTVTFNRFMACEDISLGQRVKSFGLEAYIPSGEGGEWVALADALADWGDGLATIGRKRIICFPQISASKLRMTVKEAKATPMISRMGVFMAPEITADIPNAGEKTSSAYNIAIINTPASSIMIDLAGDKTVKGLRYLPPQNQGAEGIITRYSFWAMVDGNWQKLAEGEFSNIVNNPIWQTVTVAPVKTGLIRLDGECLNSGSRTSYDDLEVVY